MFYGSTALPLFGAFIMRYRFELIVTFPLIAPHHCDLMSLVK